MSERPLKRRRILAVASGGGHWVQLRCLMPAFAGEHLALATVHADYVCDTPAGTRFYTIRDATRWDKFGLLVLALQLVWVLLKERPDIVLSTGAAPGFLALRLGRLFGAKTIWIDSIANVESLSLSGQRIGKHADVWLTQWEHLAKPEGPIYIGAVL
ncbi:MAG TPA: UDP-N-acetylglucosamine--LPS N-acetylglucosamine transferase [Accumulibacter sp.]|uniref:UDP-N-acetylglucosamine--LPS N-acetylglucosamine transferase n=1 Tax=Accumulibacter sp. TaxID=2053492 RepID=UPI002CFD8169|nr:UDP-N-acetylglucosamine--LPS N-acetylglucosamine transferase [Accumulibacter sp.]HRD87466.1 UDP-N-acetylglucosamine--LPS N-acetylglucosamine transferase [Accumulibacter sp.]